MVRTGQTTAMKKAAEGSGFCRPNPMLPQAGSGVGTTGRRLGPKRMVNMAWK